MAGSESKKVILAALIGNALISISKFVGSYLSGSSAMMSEGIHSLVDTVNQGLLLYGIKASKKPADEKFPFGHGKEIYFWSFVVSILILSFGAGISIYEGIHHVLHPNLPGDPTINYIILILSIIFEGGACYYAFKAFGKVKGSYGYIEAIQRGKDPSMFLVLLEDTAALIGLLIAFLGIFLGQVTGNGAFDGMASIMIGTLLALTAVFLAVETKSLLIGESANPEIVDKIKVLLSQHKNEVENINEVLTMHMGPEFILVNLSLDFKNDLEVGLIEKIIQKLTIEIKNIEPRVKKVFIEAEKASIK